MRIPRFYINEQLAADSQITLVDDLAHYIRNVLRLKSGDEICLFNGEGGEYQAQILTLEKKQVQVSIDAFIAVERESPLVTTLGLVMSKGERFDWALQKAIELGVSRVVPLSSERCEVRLNVERQQKKHQHWQKIIISACEQSGRTRVPEILPVQHISEFVKSDNASLKLVLHHRCDNNPLQQSKAPASVSLLIGPEGGLSEPEIEMAINAGFLPWVLGPRVLRTETAPLTAFALLQAQWGDC